MVEQNQMLEGNNKAIASSLTEEETKQILTPFAFEIDKSLFGLPLSVPWKRGMALLVDFIIIALLAETPGELLALLLAITFFKLGSKRRAEQMGKRRGLRKLFLRFSGAFIIFVVLVSTLPELMDEYLFTQDSAPASQQVETPEKASEQATKDEASKVEAAENMVKSTEEQTSEFDSMVDKGMAWSRGVIKDLGVSFGWAALYFTILTAAWNGQTPGKRLFQIQVIQLDGTPLSVWDSFGRYGGYGAGLATGFLGFLQIYWDPNRQAIHDKISSTIVIDVKQLKQMKDRA